jgi:hypothetical protein
MDPTVQPAGQNGPEPQLANGLNVTPPRAEDEAVAKAAGGTAIPTDTPPADLPTTEKLDAHKASGSSTQEKTSATPISDIKGDGTPGAYPTGSRVGWLEAYKRTDEPTNEFRDKSIWMDEFAGTAMFGEVWHNAAALVVIPVVCYVVFKLGGGLVSLIVIMAAGGKSDSN